MTPQSLDGLVLAGRREGAPDPLASIGVDHKSLIDINGHPMIERVLRSLSGFPQIDTIKIAAPDDVRLLIKSTISAHPKLSFTAAAGSPARSIGAALDAGPQKDGLLVTTCDHPLLTTAMVEEFIQKIDPTRCSAAIACVSKQVYQRAFPDSKRTFVNFSDLQFSGANLFWFDAIRAKPLVDFWRALEDNRKQPAKMAAAIGLTTAARYVSRTLSVDGALDRIEKKTGVRAAVITLSDPQAAIDVDKPADVELVRSLIKERAR